MNKQIRVIILLLIIIFCNLHTTYGQAAFASEDELKQQAIKLFEEDEFEEAYPLYSQLVSLYPKDPNYNYRLGVCMLYASDDKEKAIPFLEFSSKKPDVEKEAIFYLAKAYHLNYRFDDAIAQYQAYMKVASESKANKLQVERQVEMCRSGKKLLRNITDLLVLEKKDLSRADFYRAYDISGLGGKLLAKPDEESFRTPLDKKKKEKSIIYLASNNNQVYFSSFGDDLEHGKDIYLIRKLPNGEWSKPQTLGYPVNTEYDEDFPFLHPNGRVLYFCSKGHNSMGGYDIFKTTLNEETNTWNKPVNLDFPINTPDDDILYVTNEDEKEAYFSSARASKTGRTAVFHINVERKPIDVAIIKGMVIKTKDNQALDVKITVKDLGDNTILGIYLAKENGSYLINLPNGGRFMYTVEAAGFNTQSEIVLLPTQYEFKPLKQEISYEPGTDKLIIKNLFDDPVDDQSYLLALNFIKEKSKLEAGVDAANAAAASKNTANTNSEENSSTNTTAAKSADNTSTDNAVKTNPGSTSLSNDAIVKIAYDDAKDAEKEAKDLQEQADIALNLANQKNELAQNKAKEATQLMSDANSMTDNVKKQSVIEEANQASAESDELNQETVAAFNIAKKLQQKAAAKDEEAELSLQYAKALDAAVKSKNPADALEKLKEQEQKLEALSEKNGNAEPDNIYAGLKMDADVKKREVDKAIQTSTDIKQEITDNLALIETLKVDAENTKKDDLKQGILNQIEGLKEDTEQSRKDLEANDQKLAKLLKDYNGIKNEMELVSNVVDKAKTSTSEDAAASVAAIDKSKLEQQVNEIKVSSPDNPTAIAKNTNGTSGNNSVNTNAADTSSETKTNASENKTTDVAVNNTENKSENKSTDNSSSAETNSTNVAVNNSTASETKPDYRSVFTEKISAAESISDPLEKENKKAELYKEWSAAITEDIASKKEEAKNEKDKSKKKELNAAIAALEKELKSKQDDQAVAFASAEKIKQEATASDNTNTDAADNSAANKTETSDNTSSANNTTSNASDNASSNSTASLGSINQAYSDKLADAEKITDAVVREESKATVLKEWSAAINTNIEKQKQDLNTSTDPEMKALLEKKIKDAEALSKEKETMALASTEQVKKLKADPGTIAVNTTENKTSDNSSANSNKENDVAAGNVEKNNDAAVNTSEADTSPANGTKSSDAANTGAAEVVSAEEKLANAVAFAEKAGTPREQEVKKEEAYRYYIADVNEQITAKQNEVKTEKDKTKKKELNKEIAALQADVKEKQKLVDETQAKIKALDSGSLASNEVKTNNGNNSSTTSSDNTNKNNSGVSADNTSAGNTNNSAENAVTNEKSTTADNSNASSNSEENAGTIAKVQPPVTFTDPAAIQRSKEAAAANNEAEALVTKANDLKAEAAEKTNQAEKDALYVKASELIDQADAKKLEAIKLSSDANTSEFMANRNVLDQMAAASVNNKSDEVAMAEMMKDESITYFDRAQKSRTLASTVSSDIDKLAALEDATANEKIALEKQKRASEIYKKANPGFLAVVNPVNNSVTSGDQNKATNSATNADNTSASDNTTVNGNKSADNSSANNIVKTNDTNKNNTADNSSATSTTDVAVNETKTDDNSNTSAGNNKANTSDAAKTNTSDPSETKNASGDNSASNPEVKTSNVAVNETKSTTDNSTDTGSNTENKASDNSENNSSEVAVNEVKTNTTKTNDPGSDTSNSTSENSVKSNADVAVNEVKTTENNSSTNANTASNTNSSSAGNNSVNNVSATSAENKTKVVLAPTEKFERTTQPVYSASRPIPVNEALPEGLIYKVQIGAFRNPISPEQFKGMSPLTAETTSQGFTRYTAGLFTKFSTADQVKNEIRELGYKDAFVVVFLNGKRISVAEALKLQGENSGTVAANTSAASTEPVNNTEGNTTEEKNNTGNTGTNTANSVTSNTTAANTNPANTAAAENVTNVGGLFYTVQVGVFSKPVTAAKLFNIQPLYAENTANGFIRYNTGIYNNVKTAMEARNIVVAAGVKDAYITAYYQGKRISLEEAQTLVSGGTGLTNSPAVNQLPNLNGRSNKPVNEAVTPVPANEPPVPVNSETRTTTPPVEEPLANTELKSTIAENNSIPADSGIVFKVQIGAFKDEVPLQIANQFIKIANKGIKNYKDNNGLTIYTLGNFKSYEEASKLRTEISSVVTDAFIVAYNNGVKISVDEAKTLQNK
jgi:hypothetical protein